MENEEKEQIQNPPYVEAKLAPFSTQELLVELRTRTDQIMHERFMFRNQWVSAKDLWRDVMHRMLTGLGKTELAYRRER